MTVEHFVTAASILSLCVMTSSCPSKCTCFLQETKCLNASLSAIPQTINNNTVKLTMSYNNIQNLTQDSVTNLPQLRIVFLSMNGIRRLGPKILCASRELIILNLSKNEIISINSESFSCLQKLSNLYLNENKISYIDSSLFKSNSKLLLLDLRNNVLKTIISDAFKNNSLLSLVLIENNYVVLNGTSLNSFNTSFNVLDIELCKSNKISLISYQSFPRLQKLKRNTSELVAATELVSQITELFNVIKSKLVKVNYGFDDYLHYNATLKQITTSQGIPVLCYCDRMSVWFWCSEKGPAPVGLTRIYESLKCNKKHGQETQNQTNGLDSHPNGKTGQLVYVLGAIGLVCLVVTALVVAFVVKRTRNQATEENGWYVSRNSFIFQNKRDDENVYEEIPSVAA